MMKLKFKNIARVSVVVLMLFVVALSCSRPFLYTDIFVTNPQAVIESDFLLKKSEVYIDDSSKSIKWKGDISDFVAVQSRDSIKKMYSEGRVLTAEEFASNITGYYNLLVCVILGMFAVFSFLSYSTLKGETEKEVDEKFKNMKNHINDEIQKHLSDSLELRRTIIMSLRSEVEDIFQTKEEGGTIYEKIEKLEDDIKMLYELHNEENDSKSEIE